MKIILLLCKIFIILQISVVISCQHFPHKDECYFETGFLSEKETFYLKSDFDYITLSKKNGLFLTTSSVIGGYKDSYVVIRECWLNYTCDTITFNHNLSRMIDKLVLTPQNVSFWEEIVNLELISSYPSSPQYSSPPPLIPPDSCYFQDLHISFSSSGLYRVSYFEEDGLKYKYIYIE